MMKLYLPVEIVTYDHEKVIFNFMNSENLIISLKAFSEVAKLHHDFKPNLRGLPDNFFEGKKNVWPDDYIDKDKVRFDDDRKKD